MFALFAAGINAPHLLRVPFSTTAHYHHPTPVRTLIRRATSFGREQNSPPEISTEERHLCVPSCSRHCIQAALTTEKQGEILEKTDPAPTQPRTLQGGDSSNNHSQMARIARHHQHSSHSTPPTK